MEFASLPFIWFVLAVLTAAFVEWYRSRGPPRWF